MRGKKLLIGVIVLGMLPLLSMPANAATASYNISTYGGGGIGDGGPAASAFLSGAADAALVGSTVYVSENVADRIRKVTSAGVISTVSGTGVNGPAGLAADASGNLLIVDTGNGRVRKLEVSSGSISTIAGTGAGGAEDTLSAPHDIVADGSDIYIADTGNNKIKKIDAAGVVTTFAGTGGSGSTGGGGPAELAEVAAPIALALDDSSATHVLYVAESGGIRRIDIGVPSVITSLPSPGGSIDAQGLAFSNGTLYATTGRTVVAIDPSSGNLNVVAGTGASGSTGDGGSATSATFMHPMGLGFDSGGALLVADDHASRVRRLWGGNMEPFAGTGHACYAGDGASGTQAMFGRLDAVAVSSDGVYVADGCSARVRKISTSSGNVVSLIAGDGTIGPAADGPATGASFGGTIGGIARFNSATYIADTFNNAVRKIESGSITTIANIPVPQGIAFDSSGNMFIASACRVWKRDTSGAVTAYAGTGACGLTGDGGVPIAATAAQMNPHGLAVDPQDRVLIAEAANNRVRRVETNGTIVTIAGADAGLSNPTGVAVGAGGVVYIADQGNHRIRMVGGDMVAKTIAGSTAGFAGDGGAGGLAKLNAPTGVALRSNNLYVSDGQNFRARKISLPEQAAPVSTIDPIATVNQTNQTSVQVSGKTESKSVVSLTVTDGTTTVSAATPPSVGSTGTWTASVDVSSLAEGPLTFTANAYDEHGNIAAPASTVATKDISGSAPVAGITLTPGNAQVVVKWSNPDPDVSGAMVRMAAGQTPPATPTSGTEVANVSDPAVTQATASGLENCAWHSFSVFSRDAAGNYSSTAASGSTRPAPATPPATAVKIDISTGVVNYGEPVVIGGELVRAGSADIVTGEKLYLQIRRRGTSEWIGLTPNGIDSTPGRFTFMHKPAWSADYRIRHVKTPCAGDSTSALVGVAVRPVLKAAVNPKTVAVGGAAVISGTIAPSQYGQTMYLQQLYSGGSWRNVASAGLWGTGTTFSFTVRPKSVGKTYYRVYKPADSDHAGVVTPGAMPLAAVRVAITGIMYDPPGDEKVNLNSEYAAIKNTGSLAVDLYEWVLYGVGKTKKHKLPHYTLNPGATVLIHSGSGTQSSGHIYLARTTPLWKNQSDTGQLYDPRGNLASSFHYQ